MKINTLLCALLVIVVFGAACNRTNYVATMPSQKVNPDSLLGVWYGKTTSPRVMDVTLTITQDAFLDGPEQLLAEVSVGENDCGFSTLKGLTGRHMGYLNGRSRTLDIDLGIPLSVRTRTGKGFSLTGHVGDHSMTGYVVVSCTVKYQQKGDVEREHDLSTSYPVILEFKGAN